MPRPRVPILRPRPTASVPAAFAKVLTSEPLHGIDVGAARGVPDHWRAHLPYLRVDAFEPDAAECARLAASSHPNIRWHPKALAGSPGPRTLYVLRTPTGSSFFPLDPEFVEDFGYPEYHTLASETMLECTTLAAHLDGGDGRGPALVKLDTQGSELEILMGMRPEQLDDVLLVEIETEIHPAYVGQAVFADVHAHLEGAGFRLLDFRVQRGHLSGGEERLHYLRRNLSTAVGTRGLTAQVHALDAVYIRPLRSQVPGADLRSLARFATVLQLYRYYDGIFWVFDQPAVQDVLGPATVASVVRCYEEAAPRPKWWQRTGTLAHGFRRARRGSSYMLEEAFGTDGFDPPRTAWTHTYWPDA